MTLNEKNQNDIFDNDLLNELGIEYEFSDEPINRFKNNTSNEEKSEELEYFTCLIAFLTCPSKSKENTYSCKKLSCDWINIFEFSKNLRASLFFWLSNDNNAER